MGVLAHFFSCVFLGLGVLAHFSTKIKQEKLLKTHKDFELYQVFMYNFLCQHVLICPHIIHEKN